MLFLALTGCIAIQDDDPEANFEYIWSELDARYGGFDHRGIDWDEVYDTWRPQVDANSDDDALFAAVSGMLAELDDGHVKLIAPDHEVFDANHVYRDHLMEGTFDEEVVRTYLTDPQTGPWDWYLWGGLAPGVEYVWFPGIDDNTYVIDDMVDKDPKAIIIDLRHSHGGAYTYPLHGMGRLTEHDVPVWRSRTRNGPERGSFDAWMTWTWEARQPYWGGDIVVLVDAETISASERVLLQLRELPNVTFVGVTSNGALATSIGRQAPNGWFFQMPVQELEAMDGTVFEGVGMPVDIESLNDPADVAAGRDATLELALELVTAE